MPAPLRTYTVKFAPLDPVIQVIVSQCNHVKSCKTNKQYNTIFAVMENGKE